MHHDGTILIVPLAMSSRLTTSGLNFSRKCAESMSCTNVCNEFTINSEASLSRGTYGLSMDSGCRHLFGLVLKIL